MDYKELVENFLAEFNKITPLNSATAELLLGRLHFFRIEKKAFLLKPGQMSRTMNFIAKGCMRCYYTDETDNEHVLQFGIENWWINDLSSFLKQEPTRMYIQALEETILIQIKKPDLEMLYGKAPEISHFFRIKFQEAYVALQERMIGSMNLEAYDRYRTFSKMYRSIEQRIPQYMVAAYLGITPEFLSYLRKINAALDS